MKTSPELLIFVTLVAICHFGITYWMQLKDHPATSHQANLKKDTITQSRNVRNNKRFSILYYNPSPFLSKNRKYAMSCNFEKCQWSNCDMTFDKQYVNRSDAAIFDGIFMPKNLNFTRRRGQVWVFAAQESPLKYGMGHNWWYKSKYIFNWTMTYNKNNTDIFLPYGEIRKHSVVVKKDFKSIALRKNKTVLMIASNCHTQSKRQEYVKKLQQFIDVDVLGGCGKKWNCGLHFRHDDECFQLLNKYKFFLAFENALCHQYFSEKFFENFNYDTIMITRSGSHGETKNLFPNGTYLATEDFKSIEDLGRYLKNLSLSDYVQLLERKSQFYSVGYKAVYQRALCDLCEKMNFPETYGKTIKDMKKWSFQYKPCLRAQEVKDLH